MRCRERPVGEGNQFPDRIIAGCALSHEHDAGRPSSTAARVSAAPIVPRSTRSMSGTPSERPPCGHAWRSPARAVEHLVESRGVVLEEPRHLVHGVEVVGRQPRRTSSTRPQRSGFPARARSRAAISWPAPRHNPANAEVADAVHPFLRRGNGGEEIRGSGARREFVPAPPASCAAGSSPIFSACSRVRMRAEGSSAFSMPWMAAWRTASAVHRDAVFLPGHL